jgi:histidinol-phosphate/aromatic aminotransferase/cobyric acid decarboxylase-like protein
MRRFRDYYRQFEEMPPEEISLELRARRDEEKRRALSRVDPLDLSGSAWHEPPHPEAVNAATFALRRALNAYPDPSAAALREAIAARHGAAPDQVALGHGAGELLRAACRELLRGGGDALVAWPGWQPLPELVEAAGGRAVPVPPAVPEILGRAALGGSGAATVSGAGVRAVLLTSPADPTGAVLARRAVRDVCAGVPEGVIVVVDEALGEFEPEGDDAAGLVAELPNLLVVRSFSKAHALAGLRAGAALGPPELVVRLAPSGGISAPAQAAAAWAASGRGMEIAARRRRAAAAAHERLAAALAGSPFSALPAAVPFAWISSDAEDGPAIAARLASRQVFVAPGALWRDDRHVRAALRGAAAIDRLAAALRDGPG